MSDNWHRQLHATAGSTSNWENLINPLEPRLQQEIIKYGDFAQATYDAFNDNYFPECYGSCRYKENRLFDELHLTKHGYRVTKYIYAKSRFRIVDDLLVRSETSQPWSKDSMWIGFVAESTDDESRRIGRRDIVMAWRGTVAPSEWISDLDVHQDPISTTAGGGWDHDAGVKVARGFNNVYTSKKESSRYNKLSASEQVMQEVERLIEKYTNYSRKGGIISFTITGHSLGGALALLNGYEAAVSLQQPRLPITVISFGAPQVGNEAFRDKMNEMGVKTLRVVVEQDIVPTLPGQLLGMIHEKALFSTTGKRRWAYQKLTSIPGVRRLMPRYEHVGEQLHLDTNSSPHLKKVDDEICLQGCHNLEVYLHLVSGFYSASYNFQRGRRDIALVNKSTGMLINSEGVPENWFQVANKGLVYDTISGKWEKPCAAVYGGDDQD